MIPYDVETRCKQKQKQQQQQKEEEEEEEKIGVHNPKWIFKLSILPPLTTIVGSTIITDKVSLTIIIRNTYAWSKST